MRPGRDRRQQDPPQHAERAAAVDQRGLLQLARDRLERDPHHEGRERQLEHRQHQASPSSEFCSPSGLSSTYSGISSVAYGTIRIARVSRNSAFRAGEGEPRERVAAEQRDQRA